MSPSKRTAFRKLVLIAIPLQLIVGTIVVMSAKTTITITPNTDASTLFEQKILDTVNEHTRRLEAIDALDLPTKLELLTVLERRSWQIEALLLGLIFTTAARGVFDIWTNRDVSTHTHRRIDDDRDASEDLS